MRCLEVGISSTGNMMMGIVAGWFRIIGVANKVNKFSFILVVSGYWGFACQSFFVGGNRILLSLQIKCSCSNPIYMLFKRITDESTCKHNHLLVFHIKMSL